MPDRDFPTFRPGAPDLAGIDSKIASSTGDAADFIGRRDDVDRAGRSPPTT